VIQYREGYKYQLAADYRTEIEIRVAQPIVTEYILLDRDGWLMIRKGYAWDGPSGPTIDTKNFMRGSLVHDALYQLMRLDLLDHDTYRDDADRILRRICLEDGMSPLRAHWVYVGVRFGGGPSADPLNDNPLLTAP
jgi:uncharacterized protein DUF1353